MGIFHLLPEAAEKFEDYFEDNGIESKITKMPLAFIIAFAAYTLILFIEKIAFDSHALIHHESDDDANNTELLSYKSKEIDSEKQNNQKDEDELDENLVEDEIKNLVTTKGKFGSFIQNQTSSNLFNCSQQRRKSQSFFP